MRCAVFRLSSDNEVSQFSSVAVSAFSLLGAEAPFWSEGDSTATNPAALTYVLDYFLTKYERRAEIRYRLLAWYCGSHLGNLVSEFATCTTVHGNGNRRDNGGLAATCIRVFKYLMPQYIDAATKTLRSLCDDIVQQSDTLAPHCERLAKLYGQETMPDRLLLQLKSGDPATLFSVLYDLLLVCQERPVVTRFWLFSACARTLLRAIPGRASMTANHTHETP